MSDALNRVVRLVLAFALGFTLTLGFMAFARSHDSWISKGGHRNAAGEWCCGEGDCFLIPPEHVQIRHDGYHVALQLAADGQVFAFETIPFAEAQPSPDGAYWRCRRPDGTRRCFFAPPPNT